MQPTVLSVFISSTWLDLQPEREAVEAALQRLRATKFVGMEYFGSRDEDTRRTSLDEVDRCHVYVGIFGGRYGSGLTEVEYRRTQELGLSCFIYFKDESAIPPAGRETDPDQTARLTALKEELRQHHTVTVFTTPDDLAAKVTADLHRWLFDEYLVPQLEAAVRGEVSREEAQALLAAIRDLSVLSQELLARLRAAGYVVAPGERNANLRRPSPLRIVDKRTLRQALIEAFSLEDLELLCADVEQDLADDGITLPVNLEMVGGSTKPGTALRLIDYLDRRGYLGYLIQAVRRHRSGLFERKRR